VIGTLPEEAYIQALRWDFNQAFTEIQDRPIRSIFLGGGTPSLFTPSAIQRILDHIKQYTRWVPDIEITMELNPGAVEHGSLEGYARAGVNRLSVGVQSFQDDKLNILGRIHRAQDSIKVLEHISASGLFRSFNIDLMYGLPGQTLTDAAYDLQTAFTFSPSHLSWYHLTLEPNTVYYTRPPAHLPQEDLLIEIEDHGKRLLKQAGFSSYEVSAFAQAGFHCVHNRHYWEFGDYLGIGAGAHGKITDLKTGQVRRYWKTRIPHEYLEKVQTKQSCIAGERVVSSAELPLEFMMNALRLRAGFSRALFEARTGLSLDRIQQPLLRAQERGLLEEHQGIWMPSELGHRFLNDLLLLF
jgi:putative oxygen-independent coproporphyrinogen III oxidase